MYIITERGLKASGSSTSSTSRELGHLHWSRGSISIATMSSFTARFRFFRPCKNTCIHIADTHIKKVKVAYTRLPSVGFHSQSRFLAVSLQATRVINPAVGRLTRLDYSSATLAGLPAHLIDRLQSVMNAAARLIFSSRKYDHVTPLLHELHWLRMRQQTEYKLAVLVYRCLHGLAPPYLASDLQRVADLDDRRRLRSSLTDALNVPSTR